MTTVLDVFAPYAEPLQMIGLLGFALYILAFKLVQMRRLCGNGIAYALLNVLAAVCVLLSLLAAFNMAAFLIQVSYILIGSLGIAMRLRNGPRALVPADRAQVTPARPVP